ncbi:hypothetical protein D9611_004494 [Ephemerocybe angulata]|uniref:Uncharacterized protein n=1 Tax=Ephemerocybe angulata TaxID=980116 RepID=A0A8H5BL27_9AGAR|nr:hypothetical protein D9611_004494 [Tulosesus angulatus]
MPDTIILFAIKAKAKHSAMRPTLTRLVRIIPRDALKVSERKILPRPTSQQVEHDKPTTMDILFQQQEQAGERWPSNIRLERAVRKKELAEVRPEFRVPIKKLLKET